MSWNKSNIDRRGGGRTPRVGRAWTYTILAVACLSASVVAVCLVNRSGTSALEETRKRSTSAGKMPDATPAATRRKAPVPASPATVTNAPAVDLFNGVPVVARHVVTNSSGAVIVSVRTADGKSHRVTHAPRKVFENPSDQLIAMALSGDECGVGMPPMPLSDSVDEDFRKSLSQPIEVLETDSDEIKRLKFAVMQVREELKDMVARGMTVRDALAEHMAEVNRGAAYRQEAVKLVDEVRRTDGSAAAAECLKAVNDKLMESGIAPIPTRAGSAEANDTDEFKRQGE